MKLARRHFIKLGLAQAFIMGTSRKALAQNQENFIFPKRQQGPSILQGATDDSQTQFSIVHDTAIPLRIYASDSLGQKYEADDLRTVTFGNHDQQITKVFFSKLNYPETYTLNVIDANTTQLLDQREFQTLDVNKDSLKFAVCSCMHEVDHKPDIWRLLVDKNPDVIFFIGDSVYIDHMVPVTGIDPAHIWNRFCEARKTLEIYYSKKLTPIFAVWDDHDFGFNDTNSKDFKYVKESQENFLNFFAQDPAYCRLLTRGPGISSAIRFGKQLVILADDRSFRDRRGSKDRYGHWGQAQEEWMLDLIRQNPGPTWLFNGSQVFPNVPWKESVSGDHAVNFSAFLQELKTASSKVIFGSGDVHYSEISKIEPAALGYQTYEITSSSIHSRNIPGSPDIIPNNRRIAGNGQRNFVLIEASPQGYGCNFTATSFSANSRAAFQMQLSVV